MLSNAVSKSVNNANDGIWCQNPRLTRNNVWLGNLGCSQQLPRRKPIRDASVEQHGLNQGLAIAISDLERRITNNEPIDPPKESSI